MAYKKLTELTLFNAFSEGEKTSTKKALGDSEAIKKATIESFKYKEQYDIIRKRFNYASKVTVLNYLDKGKILPIFDEKNYSISSTIISWLAKIDNDVRGISNITMFGDMDEAYLTIDSSRFFACLQSAAILLILFEHQKAVENNVRLLKELGYIYVRMMMKILDRDYSINSDKAQADKASFCLAKFFLNYVVGKEENSTTDAIAMFSVVNETPENMIKKFEKEAGIVYTDVKEFFPCLAESIPALRNLTFRGFMSTFIRFFGPNTIFALESLQYFLISIFSVYTGASLNNSTIIQSVSGKHLEQAFNTFFGLAR